MHPPLLHQAILVRRCPLRRLTTVLADPVLAGDVKLAAPHHFYAVNNVDIQ